MNSKTVQTAQKDQTTDTVKNLEVADEMKCNSAWLERYKLISGHPFFSDFSPRQMELLTDDALEMEFAPGQQIFRDGEPANRFYLILKGKVALEWEQADKGVLPIQTIGPGEDLGWSWLFPPYYFQFSARAIEPTKALFFYGPRLREQCEQDHDLGYQVVKRMANVILDRLQATRRQLLDFADCS